jgi:deoxycytidine triphosphate deaminase
VVLSNAEIQVALDAGRLILDPQPVPRQPTVEHPECPYSTSAVDLRLGSELAIPLPEKPFVFDLRRGGGLPLAAGAPGLAGRVEGKSSFARCGLIVHLRPPRSTLASTAALPLR